MREKPVIILFMPAFDRLRGWPAPFDNSDIPGGRDEKTAGTQSKERTAAGHGEGVQERGVPQHAHARHRAGRAVRAGGLWGRCIQPVPASNRAARRTGRPRRKPAACGRDHHAQPRRYLRFRYEGAGPQQQGVDGGRLAPGHGQKRHEYQRRCRKAGRAAGAGRPEHFGKASEERKQLSAHQAADRKAGGGRHHGLDHRV